MATTYGLVELPVQLPGAGEAAGDPGLTILADFLKAVLNSAATAAWQASGVSPPDGAAPVAGRDLPVNGVHTHDPEDTRFTENDLPALYVFRSGGAGARGFEDMAEDYQIDRTTIVVWWILRRALQVSHAARSPFLNAVAKATHHAIDAGRDPAYVEASDTDPRAPTIAADADSIKIAVATSTSVQTYSGAALDGSVGGAAMSPPRSPTVTAAGVAGDFVPGSLVTWRGINALDQDVERSVALAGPGDYDVAYDFKRVDEIEVEAQATTAGTFSFGTAARAGLGSDVYEVGSFLRLTATRWAPKTITISIARGDSIKPHAYDVLEMQIETEERRVLPLEDFDLLDDGAGGAGIDVTFTRDDGSTFSEASFD